MHGFFDDLFTGNGNISLPQIPDSFSSAELAFPYLGADNSLSNSLQNVDSSSIETEVITTIIDSISANPLTKKILGKVMSLINKAISDLSPELPFSFNLDDSVAVDAISDLEDLTVDLVESVAAMTDDVVSQFVQDITADLANPQATYKDIGSQMGALVETVATDLLGDMFSLVDSITKDGPTLAQELISQDQYITINVDGLADLFGLFGLGELVDSKLTISAADAVFFPIAMITWVAVYTRDGRSITHVSDLQSLETGELGAVDTSTWNYARIGVDAVLQELIGYTWTVNSNSKASTETQNTFTSCQSWFAFARWANDFSFSTYNFVQLSSPNTVNDFDYGVVAFRLFTASLNTVLTLPNKGLNGGEGWASNDPSKTDITQLMDFIANVAGMGLDTYEVVDAGPTTQQVIDIVGKDIFRSQHVFAFLYNLFPLEELYEYFAIAILGTPPVGAGLQIEALEMTNVSTLSESPGQGRSCAGGRGVGHGPKNKK